MRYLFIRREMKEQAGFTLIELLTVISIIGLLGSVVLSNLNAARAKARDAKRISDISNLRTALIAYNIDTEGTSGGGAPLFTHAGVDCALCDTSSGTFGLMRARSDVVTPLPGAHPWSEFTGDLANYISGSITDPLDNPIGTNYHYTYAVWLTSDGTNLYDYLTLGVCSFSRFAVISARLEGPGFLGDALLNHNCTGNPNPSILYFISH